MRRFSEWFCVDGMSICVSGGSLSSESLDDIVTAVEFELTKLVV